MVVACGFLVIPCGVYDGDGYSEVFHPRFSGDNLKKNKVLYARLANIAVKHRCKPSQLALAWILHRGNDVAPIPGTTKIKHLDDNINTLLIKLTEDDMKDISSAVSIEEVAGDRLYGHLVPHSWKFANTPAKESNI
ncbi:hypothetical protein KFK09_005712 [Dendrobium nobile]|uniref:NADP-dependent oxidoreductase domain-containing protein n=1 Tax=Dendrobium nobile TaxID=94219 RepID=A0A8T3BWK5_DENNO|nr:hypothetical protein KFK09_005712 [Dendrobium nobile]